MIDHPLSQFRFEPIGIEPGGLAGLNIKTGFFQERYQCAANIGSVALGPLGRDQSVPGIDRFGRFRMPEAGIVIALNAS